MHNVQELESLRENNTPVKSKHINLKIHFVRDVVNQGGVEIEKFDHYLDFVNIRSCDKKP